MGELYRLKAIIDNNNNQITLSYQNGLLAKVSGDNGSEVSIKGNLRQKVITIIDHHELEVTYHDDNLGRLTDIDNNLGNYISNINININQMKQILEYNSISAPPKPLASIVTFQLTTKIYSHCYTQDYHPPLGKLSTLIAHSITSYC